MKIALLPNLPYGDTVSLTKSVIGELNTLGAEVSMSEDNKKFISSDRVKFEEYDKALGECDAAIIIGGDGTVTKYASDAAVHHKPILAINGGHLGFLSGLEKTEISRLSSLVNGEYKITHRMVLLAETVDENGLVRESRYCLNDAVIGRAINPRMVDVTIKLDSHMLGRHRADGIIISTPTGSTAYSMSAGGPVVDPHIECIIVTPICSHSLTARSVVCSSESTLELINSSDPNDVRQMCLVTDSRKPVDIPYKSRVRIRKADITADFIKVKKQNFYEVLNEKMIERNSGEVMK